jgi:hypothetical protein
MVGFQVIPAALLLLVPSKEVFPCDRGTYSIRDHASALQHRCCTTKLLYNRIVVRVKEPLSQGGHAGPPLQKHPEPPQRSATKSPPAP